MFENANVNAKMKMQTLPMSLQNIDITTLLGHYQYQILRCFAKFFAFTVSKSCLNYLCSKCRKKYFRWDVSSKV